jgi:hypothetical protein
VQPAPPTTDPDPEFHRPVERLLEIDHQPEAYLRLVANPFLGICGFLAWIGLVILFGRHWFDDPARGLYTPLALLALGVLPFALPLLFHYHCLDCGATGRLTRWRSHVCPASSERRRYGRPRRLRGPTPPTQVVLWFWAVLTFGMLATSLLGWASWWG